MTDEPQTPDAEQQRAIAMLRAIDTPAPDRLRQRVDEMITAQDRPRSRRRPLFLPAATAVAIVVAAIVIALSGGGASAPTIPQTAHVALAAATLPAPAEDPTRPGLLALRVGQLAFPYYGARSVWQATGARTDTIAGRHVVTVFYTVPGGRVGYAIVSGAPLHVTGGAITTQGGVHYTLATSGSARLITWRRDGHTCVIAGRSVTDAELLALASAEASGPA